MRDTRNYGPLAGVSAGTGAVLFAFGVLALAWHRVAAQVSLAIAVLAYTVIAAAAVIAAAGACYVFLWVRHRARNPDLLSGRRAVRAAVIRSGSGPDAIGAARPAAIEPPRAYLAPEQLEALTAPVTNLQLPPNDHRQGPA